jgi:hypothetical protein
MKNDKVPFPNNTLELNNMLSWFSPMRPNLLLEHNVIISGPRKMGRMRRSHAMKSCLRSLLMVGRASKSPSNILGLGEGGQKLPLESKNKML